jgi:hypothetical protein
MAGRNMARMAGELQGIAYESIPQLEGTAALPDGGDFPEAEGDED